MDSHEANVKMTITTPLRRMDKKKNTRANEPRLAKLYFANRKEAYLSVGNASLICREKCEWRIM